MTAIFWFRRDLRLADNVALELAASEHDQLIGLFVLRKPLQDEQMRPRIRFLAESLDALDKSIHNRLVVRSGEQSDVLAKLAAENDVNFVYATRSFSTFSAEADKKVSRALADAGVELKFVGSPYAVEPGSIMNKSGSPFKVFTPFFRAWKDHGWDEPGPQVDANWVSGGDSEPLPSFDSPNVSLPPAGETAALARFEDFLADGVRSYKSDRDLPGVDGTSYLSAYLKWGVMHPRQLLSRLDGSESADVFRSELCWREFYADVLFHRPETATSAFNPKLAAMQVDSGSESDVAFAAWCEGNTGFPIVDAGMRQLKEIGWMHNRVRMIVASFLVKDLHIDWTRGADWFMFHLVDGDLASNSHGWQWVAGTGTDASPYFRIFNPMTQSKKFDPQGVYLRKWVPEIAHLSDKYIHEPWTDPFGAPAGYPPPMVDHAAERKESLRRYEQTK